MSQPNRDHGSIDAGLQHFHGCGVAQNMWTNVFFGERRTYLLCSLSVFGHEMLNRVGTESSASRAREQETRCILSLVFDPGIKDRCGRLRQRSATFLSALSFATDVGAGARSEASYLKV